MNQFKLSIIVPVYNGEDHISRCLNSILNQISSNVEVIIINDCSTDRTLEKIKIYQNKYKNIKIYLNQKNEGLSFSRNKGIEISNGEYIWFVDADDEIIPSTLQSITNQLKYFDVLSLGINNLDVIDNNNFGSIFEHNKIFISACLYIVKKDYLVANNFKFIEGIFHEDLELIPKILAKTTNIKPLNIVAYKRNINQKSITQVRNLKKSIDLIFVSASLYEESLNDKRFLKFFQFYSIIALNYSLFLLDNDVTNAELLTIYQNLTRNKQIIKSFYNQYNKHLIYGMLLNISLLHFNFFKFIIYIKNLMNK